MASERADRGRPGLGLPGVRVVGAWAHALVPWEVRPPRRSITVVMKAVARYAPEGGFTLVAKPPAPSGETYLDGQRAPSSPFELAPFKPQADVLVRGYGYPSHPGGATGAVRLTFGEGPRALSRTVAVFGPRRFRRLLPPSDPAPFERVPLRYDRAFGGPGFAHNPVGRGHGAGDEPPQLEEPSALCTAHGEAREPCCLGPRALAWSFGASGGARYDRAWVSRAWPFFPDGFDWSAYQAAAEPQRLPYLGGDEPFELLGARSDRVAWAGRLPAIRPRVLAMRGGEPVELSAHLDTVVLDAEERAVELTWRAVCELTTGRLREIERFGIVTQALAERPAPLAAIAELLARAPEAEPAPAPKPTAAGPVASAPPRARSLAPREAPPEREARTLAADPAMARIFELAALRPDEIPLRDAEPLPAVPLPTLEALVGVGIPVAAASALLEMCRPREEPPASFPEAVVASPPQGRHSEDEPRAEGDRASLEAAADLRGVDWRGRDLSGAQLAGATLDGARLDGCRLDGATLDGASLRGASLRGATLTGASLRAVRAAGVDLAEADLGGACLEEADLERASLDRVKARGAQLSGVRATAASFERADLSDAVLDDARLERAQLSRAVLRGASLARATLERARLFELDARGARFVGARLGRTMGDGIVLADACLDGCDAVLACWRNADLRGASLRGAKLGRATLSFARAAGAQLGAADLAGARLDDATLDGASLAASNLYGATLAHASLRRADLRDASLYRVATFRCDLTNARLDGALVAATHLPEGT